MITKVRRLTRNPSTAQITDAEITEYINTFYAQDFPNWCKTIRLHNTGSMYTVPFYDYVFIDEDVIINVEAPIYINGNPVYFTQSEQEFFNLYPQNRFNYQIGTGDGLTIAFDSTFPNNPVISNAPLLISSYSTVSFTSVDLNNNQLVAYDDVNNRVNLNNAALIGDAVPGSVFSYLDGSYSVIFTNAPADGAPVFANVFPVTYGQPDTLLYYDRRFYIRPVANTPFEIRFEQDTTVADLAAAGDEPSLQQWWQYIAYGAAKKILEDKMDMETVNLIMPEFKNQERLVMRRVLNQQAQKRSTTIYTAPSYNTVYGWPYLNN